MKILFFVSEDWYFVSHRLGLASAARRAGFDVTVVTRASRLAEVIRAAGLKLIHVEMRRSGTNPAAELRLLRQLAAILRAERPDIVHNVALKPVIYGTMAARLARVPVIVNAVAGLGWIFATRRGPRKILAHLFRPLLVGCLRRGTTIIQNPDDQAFLIRSGVSEGALRLIRGAGVDTSAFSPRPESDGVPIVMLAARLLWDKGIREFAEAAQRLHAEGITVRFVLVGAPDHDNPGAVPEAQLHRWVDEGRLEWWGYRDDMDEVLPQAHVVALPSAYPEGVPKVLLEAAACGRPIVATDTPGCREIVRHRENGLLVPEHDAKALAGAIRTLVLDPDLRRSLGAKGRAIATAEFDEAIVVAQTLSLYRDLLVQPEDRQLAPRR